MNDSRSIRGFRLSLKEYVNWKDQQRLACWLNAHSGRIVVSNHATDRILSLYEDLGFAVQVIAAPRRISSNGDRQPALEMLAIRGF